MASVEMRSTGAAVARWLTAAMVIFFVGLVGFMAAFIDLSPGEIMSLRITVVALLFFLGSALVGVLLPKMWYLAALTAWGPLLMGGVSLYVQLVHDEAPRASAKLLVLSLVVMPLLALLSGLAGRWFILRRRSLEGMAG